MQASSFEELLLQLFHVKVNKSVSAFHTDMRLLKQNCVCQIITLIFHKMSIPGL